MPIIYRRIIYFFLAAYAFTWIGWFGIWLLPSDNWPLMNPLGPLMAAPLVIWLTEGSAGLKAWFHRIARFRAPAWVYGAAFLIPLAIILLSMALTAATRATMRPFPEVELIEFIIMIPIILLFGPGPEEVSFRGHALPQLQQTMSPLAASLWIGLGVVVWHTPLILNGDLPLPWMITIVLVSIIYTWLYNVGGSVWPLVALHFVVNYFGSEFLGAIVSDPQTRPVYALIFCAFYACWAALLVWRYGPALGRQPGARPTGVQGNLSGFRAIVPLLLVLISFAFLIAKPHGAIAETPTPSPLLVHTTGLAQTVRLADDRTHLVYELLFVNPSSLAVTVDSISILNADTGDVIAEMHGDLLGSTLRLSLVDGSGTVLQPSQSGLMFVDAELAPDAPLPAFLRHRVSVSLAQPESRGTVDFGGVPAISSVAIPQETSFDTPLLAVDAASPIVLAPPVRGADWLMFRGCCALTSSHRGTTEAFDGVLKIPERFAIDFIQLSDDGLLIDGAANEVASYRQYSQPVYAVADGRVVDARSTEPNQTPGVPPSGLAQQVIGGNVVILDVGNGTFVYYAHLQRGSVMVERGDIVKAGDVVGLIGNSGNTFGPHLHMHVIDGPDPFASDGVPFVFSSFTGQGMLIGDVFAIAFSGQSAPIDREAFAGVHELQYPLNNQVIDFGR